MEYAKRIPEYGEPGLEVGSKFQDSQGYIWVKVAEDDPYYPITKQLFYDNGWVQEHRLVMAKHLGRCLETKEKVYRLSQDRADNRIENLTLEMPKAQRMRAFRAIRAKRGRQACQL